MAHEVIDDIIGRECGEEITTMTGCMFAIEDITEIVGTIMNCAQNGGTCKTLMRRHQSAHGELTKCSWLRRVYMKE